MGITFFENHFTPSSHVIVNITQSNPAIVTTLSSHGYSNGLVVRLIVPNNCGMTQVHNQIYDVTVTGPTTFTIPVDTSNFDSFGYSSLVAFAQVLPIGEPADTLLQAEQNANNIVPEF